MKKFLAPIAVLLGFAFTSCNLIESFSVADVTLSQPSAMLFPGNTLQLTATIVPATALNKDVTWSSSNTAIASVDANGLVTAKTTGNATITVTAKDGGKSAVCFVVVSTTPTKVTMTTAATDKVTLFLGGSGMTIVEWGDGKSNTETIFSESVSITRFEHNYSDSAPRTVTIYATQITYLDCHSNKLKTIDVSECAALTYLECLNNQLTTLDVSGCKALKTLFCSYNQLATLNVSGCTAITQLYCSFNQLTTLNMSGYSAITHLYCTDNKLESLNVTGCTALKNLSCENNKITSVIPDWFSQLAYFKHDVLYTYHADGTYTENLFGWWYDGEPDSGIHAPAVVPEG